MIEQKVKKAWYKRGWAIILFIFIGLIILGSFFEDNPSTSDNSISNVPSNLEIQKETTILDQGNFKVIYSSVKNRDHSEYERIFKDAQIFEKQAEFLNYLLTLPYDQYSRK